MAEEKIFTVTRTVTSTAHKLIIIEFKAKKTPKGYKLYDSDKGYVKIISDLDLNKNKSYINEDSLTMVSCSIYCKKDDIELAINNTLSYCRVNLHRKQTQMEALLGAMNKPEEREEKVR